MDLENFQALSIWLEKITKKKFKKDLKYVNLDDDDVQTFFIKHLREYYVL